VSQILHGLTLALTAGLLARLWREGLHARYRSFFAALVFELASGLLLYWASGSRNLYSEIFFATTAINWVLRYLVLRELCLLVFHDHPGIEAAVRVGVRLSLVLAITIPLGVLLAARIRSDSRYPLLDTFFLFHQSATFFLTFLLTGTVVFVAWFPVALRRNIVLYCIGFSIKFLGESALLLFRNATISREWRQTAATIDMVVGLTVVAIWTLWLSRKGEQPLVSVGQLLRPNQADRALRHLDRLNSTLANVLPRTHRETNQLK
jgi:hypothetical protein